MGARNIFDQILADGWSTFQKWVADREQESEHLEFKCQAQTVNAGALGDGDKANLARGLSGFANTAGGVIVFGISTKKGDKRHPDLAASICAINEVDAFKGEVERNIKGLTEPPVSSVGVCAFPDPNDKTRGIVVIYVPASDGGPHRTAAHIRAEDGSRYYMRTATDTVVMPHALLADRFHRTARSRLRLIAQWEGAPNPPTNRGATLRLRITNRGRGTARQPAIQIATFRSPLAEFRWEITRSYHNQPNWDRIGSQLAGNFALLLQSAPEVVVYPGVEFEIAYGAMPADRPPYPGSEDPNFGFIFRGFIYSADAQPFPFEHTFLWSQAAEVELPATE